MSLKRGHHYNLDTLEASPKLSEIDYAVDTGPPSTSTITQNAMQAATHKLNGTDAVI